MKRARSMLSLLLVVGVFVNSLALGACQVDLPLASKIEHLRTLGASTEVEGDSDRSSPAPGETAHVTWTMAYPDPAQTDSELASLFYVCTAPSQYSGAPICQEFIDIARGGSVGALADLLADREALDCAKDSDQSEDYGPFRVVCVTGTPKFDVKISKDDTAKAKLMRGIICRNGTPHFDEKSPTQMSCKPDDSAKPETVEEIAVYGTIPIQYDEHTTNHQPDLDAATIFFHEPPILWEESSSELSDALDDESCAELAYEDRVMSTDGHEESITLRYDADAREEWEGAPEMLTFTSYTTFGEISDRFTVFRPETEPPLSRTFTWTLTEDERKALNKKSKLVRFYFTVRDGRGGYAATSRDVCVVRQARNAQ